MPMIPPETNTVFGWGIIGRMENKMRKIWWKTVFSTVWHAEENTEDEKSGRKFSLLGPQFASSQIGRKILEKTTLTDRKSVV